ncbi:TonB-dependent receptor [Parafilimonas sp.]|uniref:TonB-dependent receptor n=1 Tax=Parafilimonas sp. TaxID=1969739 RepID=UPI003F7EBBC2
MQNINNSKQIKSLATIRSTTDQLQNCTTQLKLYLCCKTWSNKKYFKHLQYTVLAITTMFIMNAVTAQTIVKGTVTDKKKAPVENASIKIKNTAEATISDSTGIFSFITHAKGNQVITVSSIGFEKAEKQITVNGSTIIVNISLGVEEKNLKPVIVSAGSFEASDKAKGASLTPMDAMTVAGNGGDISNSLRSLPGAQQIGDKEGLFVRGGTNEETKQFIDGTLMPVPNYASVPGIIQPARINPFLFKGVLFNTGGYSALYGEALSSALILESVDLPDESSASLHLFPMAQGAGFQKLAKNKKSSWGVNGNYGNYSLYNNIVKQHYDFTHAPEYISGDANLRIKTNNGGMLKFYTNYGYNHTGVRSQDIDSAALNSLFNNKGSNLYANLSYRQPLQNKWKLDAAIAYNFSDQKITNRLIDSIDKAVDAGYYPFNTKNNNINTRQNFAQARIVFTKAFRRNQALRFGAENFYTNHVYHYNNALSQFNDNLTAAFAEGDVYIAKNIAAKIGMRAEHSTLLNKTNLAPRLSLAYRLHNGGQFNMAYGIFFQKPGVIYFLQNNNLNYTRATHYVLNYQRKFNNRLIRIEAYYKQYKNLLTTFPDTATNGNGYAKGIELFFRDKRTFKNFDYWISYTYLDTKRKFLNYPRALQPNFATPHTASVAIKRFFPDINFNANLSYSLATGRPYYNIQHSENKTIVADEGKTNMYSQMNLSFAYLFTMFKNWKHKDFSGIGFGINNVFGTKQTYNYNYSYNGAFKTPVTMPATRSFYLGLFMTFGIDRRDDFINDNL